jgi:hypothetical protein
MDLGVFHFSWNNRPEGLKNGQILRENLTALARGASVGTFHPSTHLKHTQWIFLTKE